MEGDDPFPSWFTDQGEDSSPNSKRFYQKRANHDFQKRLKEEKRKKKKLAKLAAKKALKEGYSQEDVDKGAHIPKKEVSEAEKRLDALMDHKMKQDNP